MPGAASDAGRAVSLAAADYLRHGITTAQEGAADPTTVAGLAAAAGADGLPLDVVVYPVVQWGRQAFTEHPELAGDYRNRLRLCEYKMIDDPRRLTAGTLGMDERALRAGAR